MRHHLRYLPALLTLTSLVLTGCNDGQKEPGSGEADAPEHHEHVITLTREATNAMGLRSMVVEEKPLIGHMTLPATLVPNQDLEAQVGSLVQGRVREVFVTVGAMVKEHQELMRIEGLEVGQIKSNFIKAKAQLSYAEAAYERQKTLLAEKVGSQKTYLEAQAEYNKALAEFDAEDKRIHSIGLSDADVLTFVEDGSSEPKSHTGGVLPIKAPIAGTVVERNVVIGQLVDASTTAFRIINTSTLWADGRAYESDLPALAQRPNVTLTVTAFPGEEFTGKVIYIAPIVDPQSRTITVRAAIPNRGGRLKPQMFGELRISTQGNVTGILVPAEAVQRDGTVSYVFIATSDTTFERRDIQIGTALQTMLSVRQGVRAGERIVTNGSFQLKSELMKETLEEGE
ncbi:MAG: efflux RND transporter periplasmic adaptor subunit [Bacteroidetes bacterium]|nr:efflux RND transporter periplasmic adaptor subunit [Bacteroidota bacterium]